MEGAAHQGWGAGGWVMGDGGVGCGCCRMLLLLPPACFQLHSRTPPVPHTPPPAPCPQLVHGDVFRFPPNLNLFCAVVGTGTQILAMSLLIFSLSLLGTYYPYNGGAMLTSVVVLYALTAGIAGYVSSALYKIMGGEL